MFDTNLVNKIRLAFPRAEKDFNGRTRAFFDNGTGSLVLGKAAESENKARIDASPNVGAVFNGSKKAGSHIFIWEAENIASGIYFIKLSSEKYTETIKCTIIK